VANTELLDDEFLDLDHTAHLDVLSTNVEAAKEDAARRLRFLYIQPVEVQVVALPNGRSEMRVTYSAGTPEKLFNEAVLILGEIEAKYR
jgi:hypothetical protein